VTFAFVTFRVINDSLPSVAPRLGNSPDDSLANLTWLTWVLPLAVYELILQSRRLYSERASVSVGRHVDHPSKEPKTAITMPTMIPIA
jgi:hypothetical protein